MNMKIGIVTQQLYNNYGAFLQTYALQKMLQRLNFEPVTIDYQFRLPYYRCLLSWVKTLVNRLVGKKRVFIRNHQYQRTGCFSDFADKHLKLTEIVHRYHPQLVHRYEFDAVISGSDQVWRCAYNYYMADMFLRFVKTKSVKKIAYAASFGCSYWDGGKRLAKKCATYARKLDAISVRENSGIQICRDLFGVTAVQMPDPTLLATVEDYETVIDSDPTDVPCGNYFASYVLDSSASIQSLISELQNNLKMPGVQLISDRREPVSIAQWLRSVRDCDYFVTDSFHGCVFAIIYNKPFVCLGNEGRGSARFDTLLGIFGLEGRMCTSAAPEEVRRVLDTPIDWERVNAIHDSERERGINFLKENLTCNR